jgi:hypothetical protein
MPLTTANPAAISRIPSSSQIQPPRRQIALEHDRLHALRHLVVVLPRPDRVEDLEDPADHEQ